MAAQRVLNSWLLEYVCDFAWNEFLETKNVKQSTTRDLVQGVISLHPDTTPRLLSRIHFLSMICRLADGNEYTTMYDETKDIDKTPLESCLISFDRFVTPFMDKAGDPSKYKESLLHRSLMKAQSVLVCYRAGDFQRAETVFDRQYTNIEHQPQDKIWASKLRLILRSKNKNVKSLMEHTYEKFLDKMVKFFKPFIEFWDRPYLLKLSESYCQIQTNLDQNENRLVRLSDLLKTSNGKTPQGLSSDSASSFCNIQQKKVEELVSETLEENQSRNNNVNYSSSTKATPIQTDDVIEEVTLRSKKTPEDRLSLDRYPDKQSHSRSPDKQSHNKSPDKQSHNKSPDKQSHNKSPDKQSPDNNKTPVKNRKRQNKSPEAEEMFSSPSPLKKTPSKRFVYRKNLNRENRHEAGSAEIEDDSDGEPVVPSKIPRIALKFAPQSRPSLAPPANGVYRNIDVSLNKGSRKFWTDAETSDLYKAVKKYGVGNWAKIRQEMNTERTNVNVKDRWRNIVKNNEIEKYIEVYGSLE